MLPKVHLTSHSRIFGSRWVMTPPWLCGSWKFVFCSSSVYSCHLCLIFSASVRSIPFIFLVSIFAWNVPLVSLIFLKRSFPFYCFPLFLCIDHWGRLSYLSLLFFGTLHPNAYIFPFLLCLWRLLFAQLFVRPPRTTICHFPFLFLGDGLDHCLLYNVMNLHPQFSGTLSDLIPWIYLSLPPYNHKGFDLGHTWMA